MFNINKTITDEPLVNIPLVVQNFQKPYNRLYFRNSYSPNQKLRTS